MMTQAWVTSLWQWNDDHNSTSDLLYPLSHTDSFSTNWKGRKQSGYRVI